MALKELGITELIVGRDIIIDTEETEADVRFKQIIANVQREDLNPIEMGNAFVALKEEFGYQYNETAEIIGRTPHYVASKVGLAKRLDAEVQQLYIRDLEQDKFIRNTPSDDAPSCYLMNVNVLEDIARLPVELQRPAYEAIAAEEMDKGKAMRFLKSLKKAAAAGEGRVALAGSGAGRGRDGIRRRIHRIGTDIEKLFESMGGADVMERDDVVPELERLIEKLSLLCIRIKVKDADVAEIASG